jgi:zinc protease
MHRVLLLTIACLLVAPAAMAQEDEMPRIFPYETHIETLDNGLKVILVPMSSDGLVAYWSVVRTGSRDEYEKGHSGFAHFFEHMMFRGTEAYPAEVYNEMITKMGADANAFTTDDLTAYHLGVTVDDLETVIKMESDRFRNLAYSEQVFQTEAGAVYGEYRKNRMNPFFALFEAVQETAFKKHTYGHTTMGFVQDIKAMPQMYEYSKSFFKRYYRPENVVLLITGDIDIKQTMGWVRENYEGWETGYVTPKIEAEPAQTEERRVEVAYAGQSLPILWVAYKIDGFDPEDRTYLAAGLLADLAFGETSEIHKKLVLGEQVVEFIAAGAGTNRDPGLLDIYTRVKDPSKVDYVLGEIDKVVKGYRENPPDAARLVDMKSNLKYGFLMSLDTPDRVASQLARLIAITGGVAAVDRMYSTIDGITPEDLQAAANKFLLADRRTIALLRGE